jgi:hypothetical protein
MLNVIKLFFEVDSFIRGHDSVDSIIYDLLLPSYMAEASLSEDPHYIMLLLASLVSRLWPKLIGSDAYYMDLSAHAALLMTFSHIPFLQSKFQNRPQTGAACDGS